MTNDGIEHRGGDVWRVRVYVPAHPITGRRGVISRNFRAKTETQARKIGRQIKADIEREQHQRAEGVVTVAQLCAEWTADMERRGRSATTMYRNRSIVDRISKDLGHIALKDLTGRVLDRWYGELAEGSPAWSSTNTSPTSTSPTSGTRRITQPRASGTTSSAQSGQTTAPSGTSTSGATSPLSPSTIHHYHRVLRQMLRKAYKWGMVEKVATEYATPPSVPRRRATTPTLEAVQAFLAHADSRSHEVGTILHLAAATGARRGELVALRWADLDVISGLLTIDKSFAETTGPATLKTTKSGRGRIVRLDPRTVLRLEDHHRQLHAVAAHFDTHLDRGAWMFPNMAADPRGLVARRPGWLSLWFKRLQKETGASFRLHDLRHWHATRLIAGGMDVTTVSHRLGHADTSTTLNIYSHPLDERDRAAAELIGPLLTPKELKK